MEELSDLKTPSHSHTDTDKIATFFRGGWTVESEKKTTIITPNTMNATDVSVVTPGIDAIHGTTVRDRRCVTQEAVVPKGNGVETRG